MGILYMRLIDSRYGDCIKLRNVYMVDIIFQNFESKRKSVYLVKKYKDLCSLQRLIEEQKILSMKTNFRVPKGACYRFNNMKIM
jgi:hypothetical protein